MSEIVKPPYPQFNDPKGEELNNGFIYIGEEGKDPQTNPITVYWDEELTQPSVQPLRTINGYISRAGTPSRVWVNSRYSITVKTKKEAVYQITMDCLFLCTSNSSLQVKER